MTNQHNNNNNNNDNINNNNKNNNVTLEAERRFRSDGWIFESKNATLRFSCKGRFSFWEIDHPDIRKPENTKYVIKQGKKRRENETIKKKRHNICNRMYKKTWWYTTISCCCTDMR